MLRPRTAVALAAAAVLTGVVGVAAAGAGGSTSPACLKATHWVAVDQSMIQRLGTQTDNTNPNGKKAVNPTRRHQIAVRRAELQADLVKARAAKKKACANEPKVWTLADYNGNYAGRLDGTNFDKLAFTVTDGVVAGDLVSTAPLDPATGNVTVQASFAGADCGTATLHINPATGEAKTTATVTCHLGGQQASGEIIAQRATP